MTLEECSHVVHAYATVARNVTHGGHDGLVGRAGDLLSVVVQHVEQ